MNPSSRRVRYAPLDMKLPRHLVARLQAVSTALDEPVEQVVGRALELYLQECAPEREELIDRIAATLLNTTELDEED